ncbi:MAG: amidase family protein, partial [Bacteroidota bacterium]
MNPTPKYTSLEQVQHDLRSGTTSCKALVQHYLERIAQSSDLNAYVEVYAEEALAKAEQLDQKIKDAPESLGRLAGMVLSHKDVICYKDHGVTGASKILEGFQSLFSATAVERVLAEDAIIIGRTNCDQFAMGSTNENSVYGPVKNAADPTRVPGGSSGGSAVSVQADTCLAALGTDTGGSVRQPAALCGVMGMKPTYGRISRYGLLAYGSSFDQLGVITHSVSDASILMEIMAGPDDFDSTASQQPVVATNWDEPGQPRRIAYFETALHHESMDPDVRQQSLDFLEQLKAAGHHVEAVDFEYLDYIIPAYYVLTTAEASSNLARYDGIRYGYRSEGVSSLMDTYKKSRTEGFSEEVKRRIMLGTFVLSS